MLSFRERVLHAVGCAFIGSFILADGLLLFWLLVHGGAALAGVSRGSSFVLAFGIVGYSVSLVSVGLIFLGLVMTFDDWCGVFSDMKRRREWARGNGGRHEN